VKTIPIRLRNLRGQLVEQQRVQRVVRDHGDAERENVFEYPVIAQEGGSQDEIADVLMVTQPAAVPDHEHEVGTEHGEVVGDRLRVGRANADVHDRQPGSARPLEVPGRHLPVRGVRPGRGGQRRAELRDVPPVVVSRTYRWNRSATVPVSDVPHVW